jgi:hypothetical protein
MGNDTLAQRKTTIILLLSAIAAIIYLISIKLAYPVFQNTRLTDPLAQMHSLFPLYYIAITLVAMAGFACFAYRIKNRGVHLLLLLILAIMLLYTPYYMAGFSRLPDTAKNVGVALYAPDILRGNMAAIADYCANYPSSYIYSWISMNSAGMEPLSYMRFFPLLCICVFVLLGYTFISKLFNSRIAFLAMLITIPGLHYITSHASAHSIGVLLLLTALVLLFHKGIVFRILTFVAIIAVFICHPISPLLLSIFLAAALLTSYAGRVGRTQVILATMLVVCFVGWFLWPTVPLVSTAAPGPSPTIQEPSPTIQEPSPTIQEPSPTIQEPSPTTQEPSPTTPRLSPEVSEQAGMMYRNITPGGFDTTRQYLLGTPFIYGSIHRLNILIYITYALAAVAGILYLFFMTYFCQKSLKRCFLKFGGLSRNQLFMALSVVVLLALTVLLAERGHVLIERGLTFIILGLSCLIASIIVRLYHPGSIKKFVLPVVLALTVFLTLSFPVVAYSVEAYTNFPASEQAGLEFLANDVLSEKRTLTTTSSGQLSLYTLNFTPVKPPKDDFSKGAEIVVFRSTGYYYTAMRHDLSFEDNGFTRYRAAVSNYDGYHRIYLNQSTEIYATAES